MITLTQNVKAASRKDAFAIVTNMMADRDFDADPRKAEELESLYRYFMPAAPKIAKTAFQWVAKACDSKSILEFKHYVHVVSGIMYASDGHRLHWTPTELADGAYNPKTSDLVDWNGSVPNFAALTGDKYWMGNETVSTLEESVIQDKNKALTIVKFLNGCAVSKQYLLDANNGENLLTIGFDAEDPASNRVKGSTVFGEYVIMPTRV